jgi:glutamate/tyrosine decarboxylase-like PLP-dependent enzyme
VCTKEEAIRNIAKYLEENMTDVLHPVGLQQLCRSFKRKSKEQQVQELKKLNAKKKEIKSCKNQKDRVNLYNILTKKLYE